jgi:DNA-binding NtrC family response regulator
VALESGELFVGGGAECGLVLHDPAVSHRHLRLVAERGAVLVEDLGSKNGTYYLGQRLERISLRSSARLELGRTHLDILPLTDRGVDRPRSSRESYGALVGTSPAMRELYALLEMIERSAAPVLLCGETGTGKELVARAIHEHGPQAAGPFIVIDCAAIPGALIESELFGHCKGAFTGAVDDRPGAFAAAHTGTVFLDEVGELPLELQPRLLRVLETGQVKPVGEARHREVEVRVIAATHRDLEAEYRARRFREDLYFRLSVVSLTLPPLRARREDIPLLTHHLTMAATGGKTGKLARAALDFFMRYDWPGNVRELRNAVERVLTLGELSPIPGAIASPAEEPTATPSPQAELDYKEARRQAIEAFERAYLADLLRQAKGNLSAAARAAGIDRKHLRDLLKKYALYGPRLDDPEG